MYSDKGKESAYYISEAELDRVIDLIWVYVPYIRTITVYEKSAEYESRPCDDCYRETRCKQDGYECKFFIQWVNHGKYDKTIHGR